MINFKPIQLWDTNDWNDMLGKVVRVTETISKSMPHIARLAKEAGMECVGDDDRFYFFEGTEDTYDHFRTLARNYELAY